MGYAPSKKVYSKTIYPSFISIIKTVVIMQQKEHSCLSFPWLTKIKKSQTPTEFGSFPMSWFISSDVGPTDLDSMFKSRDITLPAKVRLVKAMVSPVVMYGCESWNVKKAERRRIDAFELCVVLEKTLESPLDCKEIQPVHPKGN